MKGYYSHEQMWPSFHVGQGCLDKNCTKDVLSLSIRQFQVYSLHMSIEVPGSGEKVQHAPKVLVWFKEFSVKLIPDTLKII